MGNYGVILSLLGCLDHGLRAKKLVDRVIDSCKALYFDCSGFFADTSVRVIGDHVVNLREDILIHRIKYSLTNMDEDSKEELVRYNTHHFLDPTWSLMGDTIFQLGKAVKALEK